MKRELYHESVDKFFNEAEELRRKNNTEEQLGALIFAQRGATEDSTSESVLKLIIFADILGKE